ncbi:MAG: T9SS type A sorting domain-containing protein [Bacteroidales bacterium]|nr:T9SS type A sorting domain-containing protein [Bacteroidales bacterium]
MKTRLSLIIAAICPLAFLFSHSSYGQTFPDNVIETDCNRPLEGNPWNIQLLHSSNEDDVASYSPIVVGDIDGNGVTDIVVAQFIDNNYRSNHIYVYNGNDLSLQHSFSLPDSIYLSNGPYAIGRYPTEDGSMQGAIFLHCYDKKIRAYSINGTLLNVSDRPTSCDGMVSLADFNGDGFPEVYAGSDIFDAATLKWLCSGPENGNKGLSFRGTPAVSYGVQHHTYYAMSLAYDVLGDEQQELICGNTIYNVNIVSRTSPNLNSITEAKTITPPTGYTSDGHVCIADFDLDGETEVLVIRCNTNDQIVDDNYYYAYKPSNGQILFQRTLRCASASYVFIGNIDSDPHPEIVFLENQPNGQNEKIYCWRYTPQNGLETVWSQYHNDKSGMTAMTLFDFNQDNIMELVYRDCYNLRIINASGKSHITGNDTIRPYNIYTRTIGAGTGIEYPVVADVNGDGAAEIVVTGVLGQTFSDNIGYGGIYLFGSPGNWAASRPVWNQYMYHVTNVNEDLTIPTFCFDKATVFTAPDGTVRRPYNNFLQQAGYINQYGEPYNPGGVIEADLSASGCTSYTFHGTTYTQSGFYDQFVESSADCDTLYHIDVSIGGTVTHEFSDTFCGEYLWNDSVYHEPGDYVQQFVAPAGCDSIVTLHLSLGSLPAVPNIVGPQEVFVSTDLVLGEYLYSILPVEDAFQYEWSLEGADWPMSPDGTQCSLLVTTAGTATLKVKAWNDCGFSEQEIIIHAGFHDLDEFTTIPVAIYPNPANDKVRIEADDMLTVRVFDSQGQLLEQRQCNESSHLEIPINQYTSGIYLIEIRTQNGIARKKFGVTR